MKVAEILGVKIKDPEGKEHMLELPRVEDTKAGNPKYVLKPESNVYGVTVGAYVLPNKAKNASKKSSGKAIDPIPGLTAEQTEELVRLTNLASEAKKKQAKS